MSVRGWNVVMVAERVAGSWRSRSMTQATWSPPGVLIVEQPRRVAVRPAQRRDLGAVGEVGVHPGQPLGFGVAGDDRIVRVRALDTPA